MKQKEYKLYRKSALQLMRPYIPGEDLSGISVNKEDTPEPGGMIAVNADNLEDRWYVAKRFFQDNYEEALVSLVEHTLANKGDNTDELKLMPCPFCGASPFLDDYSEDWSVECHNKDCTAMPSSRLCATLEEAIEAWNKRFVPNVDDLIDRIWLCDRKDAAKDLLMDFISRSGK